MADSNYDPSGLSHVPIIDRQDDDESDFGDEEFGDMDLRQLSPPRRSPKKMLLVGLLLSAAIVMAVVFTTKNNSSSKGGVSNSNSPHLPDPPEDLYDVCAKGYIARNGKVPCEKLCEPTECCDFPSNMALSCLEGNENVCLIYHTACHHLQDASTKQEAPASIPAAPFNLAKICASDSVATIDGFAACHQACTRAECCYEDAVTKCPLPECPNYAPCLNLAATDHVDDTIPALVNKLCAKDKVMTHEGRLECHQMCSNALCCFSENGCLHGDTSFCSQYQKCDNLDSNIPVEATPSEIQFACNEEPDIPAHDSYCDLVCRKGSCCFSDFACPDNVDCDHYEPCADSGDDDTDEGGPPTNGGGDDTDDEELGLGNNEPVDEEGTGPVVEVDREEIEEACGPGNEALSPPDQPSLCETLCDPGMCCFEKSGCPSGIDCNDFIACENILEPEDDDDTDDGEGANPEIAPGPANASSIQEACNSDGEDTLPGEVSECEELCEHGNCCFQQGGCGDAHPDIECLDYVPCGKLHGIDDTDDGTEDNGDDETVREACRNSSLATCKLICEPARCCFEDGGCPAVENLDCDKYDDCWFLFEERRQLRK